MEAVIRKAINSALQDLGIQSVDFVVEHPTDPAHGDYATNVSLVAANAAGKNPRELAEELKKEVEKQDSNYIDRVEVAGPGFLNFFLSRDFFKERITHIVNNQDNWGKNTSWEGKTVFVEYTDPNPFKEFHVGHLFTNAVGESIARLFMYAGAETKRVCYQSDVGMHVAHVIWSLQKNGLAPEDIQNAKDLGRAYAEGATAYKEDENMKEEMRILNKKIYERSDEEVNALYDKGREISLAYFEEIYELVGTQFDYYFFESEAAPLGKHVVEEQPTIFPESDGARIFEGEKYGLHTRVFVNSEGLPTYEAKELALAKMKEDACPHDHSVVSTGKEINEYFKVLLAAMREVYPDLAKKTEHIGHGMVRLPEGKMSSRTGNIIAATDFISEIKDAALKKMKNGGHEPDEETATQVAIGAIKYATLKGSIFQDTTFNTEQALSFEGASGPYLQYTHARIVSVLLKAGEAGIKPSHEHVPEDLYDLERVVYELPEVVEKALVERSPHHVATYLTELASEFNAFYAKEKIADPSDEYAPYKVMIADAVRVTLKNGLWVLGIEAPEKM